MSSCAAVAEALRTHGVGRVQLIHPPWFSREFDDLGVAYFRSQGVDAVVTKAVTLPARNGFRAAAAVEELEARTGRLVLEANQALLWGILAATGTGWDVTGHGRLLQATTATTQSHRLPPAAVARTEDPS